jgi:hypothetical protein
MNTQKQPDGTLLSPPPCSPILVVDARVRYWEDATINGKDDDDGTLIPFRDGDSWKPSIDLQTGRVIGWPEGTTADIHYKVCDDGDYWLADADGTKRMKWRGHYVPDALLCMGDRGYGDYIILDVGADGQIAEWSFPVIDFEEWIHLENDPAHLTAEKGTENE